MFNRKTIMLTMGLCIIIGAVSFFTALKNIGNLPNNKIDSESSIIDENAENNKDITNENAVIDDNVEMLEQEVVKASTVQKITPSTKIVYQYYYPDDNITEQQEDVPPYFLLDLTLEDLNKYYVDWHIVTFSDKEVVMRKIVEGKSEQRYIVGQQEGYVAVFYEEEKNGISIHELTDTPISSLTKEEQVRLNDGIFVLGDSELAKVLEDYGS